MKLNIIDILLKCGEKRKVMIASYNGDQNRNVFCLKMHSLSYFNPDHIKPEELELALIYIRV